MNRPDLLFEATSVTIGNSFALRPCPRSVEIIVGAYGRALKRYPAVRLYAFNPLSNQLTDLVSSSDPEQLSGFYGYVKSNISKELKRLHKLPYEVFANKRVHFIPVAPDLASQESRFRYVMSQGTKEGLVASPRDWDGATGVHQLERDEPLVGWWFDRTAESKARDRGETVGDYDHATPYKVQLSPLPAWADHPNWRARVTEIIDEIEETCRQERGTKRVLGMKAVRAHSPRHFPDDFAKSPAPMVLAASAGARRALRRVVIAYRQAFADASRRLRQGCENVEFPPFSFPPSRPMTSGPVPPLDLAFALEPDG